MDETHAMQDGAGAGSLEVKLYSPTGVLFAGKARSVALKHAYQGAALILPRHEAFFCALREGPIEIRAFEGEQTHVFHITHGYARLGNDKMAILGQSVRSAAKDTESWDPDAAQGKA